MKRAPHSTHDPQGFVSLVGAGPGDPELLTLKALRAIERAEVVVFDRLVSEAVLELVPPAAHMVDVGKRAGWHPVPQDTINDLLVIHTRAGHTVARLKGGDPFLFGRGGEEAIALRAAGVRFEVIPGITAAQGCAAQLCVPLTHRTLATGVRFVTGHARADATLDLDWDGLADAATTLVVYMGLSSIPEIAERLVSAGRSPATPVLAVSRGTTPQAQVIGSTLGRLAADVAASDLPTPTLFIIGEVTSLASVRLDHAHAMVEKLLDEQLVAAE